MAKGFEKNIFSEVLDDGCNLDQLITMLSQPKADKQDLEIYKISSKEWRVQVSLALGLKLAKVGLHPDLCW